MFINFSQNKTRYESGQIFPFLIAIICIVIVMAMITVNLGQIALFRTDVSNAADAGALAGASVISGQLLSYGITSDMMCGQNLIKVAAIVIAFITMKFFTALPVAIAILTTTLSSNVTILMKAFTDSQMAWTNARKTAMQYAFSNVPVDEPRLTYEEFLDCMNAPCGNGVREAPTTDNYNEYLATDSPDPARRTLVRKYARNGFAKFMDDSKNGWWIDLVFGSVESGPGAAVPTPLVINGYGWTQDPVSGRFFNSFEDSGLSPTACAQKLIPNGPCWRDYENFVEVQVKSRLMYAFELVGLPGQSILSWAVFAYVFIISYPFWLVVFAWTGPLAPLIAALLAAAEATLAKILIDAMKFGINFTDPDEMIEGSPVEVTVARYKADSNVGLWKFRYAQGRLAPIRAKAQGHAFRTAEGKETIAPTFFTMDTLWAVVLYFLVNPLIGMAYFIANWDDIFDTSKHLFDVKLKAVQ